MDTNIKRKGRIAMAWLIIITMVFATMSTPFALASDVPGFDVYGITKYDESRSTYEIPGETDFIFIKQSNAANLTYALWTRDDDLSLDQKHEIIETLLKNLPGGDKSIFDLYIDKDPSLAIQYDLVTYASGLDSPFDIIPKNGTTINCIVNLNDANKLVLTCSTTISHIYYGQYDQEELTGSAQIVLHKELLDDEEALIPLLGGEFEFDLYESDEDWNMGDKVFDDSVSNGLDGVINFPTITYGEDDINTTKYYIAKEVIPAEKADGVTYDEESIKITVAIALDDEDQIEATITVIGEKEVFTNTYKEEKEEFGAIKVVKEIQRPIDEEALTVTKDFYVALFDSEAATEPISAIKVINIENSVQKNEVLFDKLVIGTTYYVFETDPSGAKIATEADGTIIKPGPATAEGYFVPDWLKVNYKDNEIQVTAATQEATIINYFDPNGEGLTGSIEVIKKVTVNNKAVNSAVQFHVGLFEDEALQTLIEEKPLVMGTVTSFDNLDANGVYYVAETDGHGKALTKEAAKELGFEISINDKKMNVVSATATDENPITIVNNFKKEEFPLTGDNSNMNLWLFLAMLGVAGAIAPFAFSKKEVAND